MSTHSAERIVPAHVIIDAPPHLSAVLSGLAARGVQVTARPALPVAETFTAYGDQLVASCPACGDGFLVPAASIGALVDCASCPWQGTVANPVE